MSARVMISPVVPPRAGVYMSKAEQYCRSFVNFFPSNQDGTPASAWVVTIGRNSDWTAADADPQIETVFAVPANIDTADELRAFLHGATVADLSAAQRSVLQAIFDAHGIYRGDFDLNTSGAKVVRRVISACLEQDFNFGMGFRL